MGTAVGVTESKVDSGSGQAGPPNSARTASDTPARLIVSSPASGLLTAVRKSLGTAGTA